MWLGTVLLIVAASVASNAAERTDRRRQALGTTERSQEQKRTRVGLSPTEDEPTSEEEAEDRARREPTQRPDQPVALDRVIDSATYRLGPGDVVVVNLWGNTFLEIELAVTPEGRILVPGVGPVAVAGSTLVQAERLVVDSARPAYGNSRLTLSLTELRTFRVHVSGMVEDPGSYVATPADRVSDVIGLAGGTADGASQRLIGLGRADGSTLPVDLALFLTTGEVAANPVVDMGDVIHVPATGDSVAVWGAVGLPGYYEYRLGDTFTRLIELAGGIREGARVSEVEWSRFPTDTGASIVRRIRLADLLRAPTDGSVRPGDRLLIPEQSSWRVRRSVTVAGAVTLPGEYSIVEGVTRLSDVLRRAGGLAPDADSRSTALVRAGRGIYADAELDRLSLMPPPKMTEAEIGYTKIRFRQNRGQTSVDVGRAVASPGGRDDPLLVDGDEIRVARTRHMVDVIGAVVAPGLVAYAEGRGVDYYIREAGGLGLNAREVSVRVVRAATGQWVEPDADTVPDPGDTIIVPERTEVLWWDAFKDGLMVASQVATVVLLAISVIRL